MTIPSLDLNDANAVITGASGGIGGALAESLGRLGVNLLLAGRSEERLRAVAGRVSSSARVETTTADLQEDSGIQALADEALERFGGVDLLIHSIGLFLGGRMDDASADHLDQQYMVNVRSPYRLTQALLPSLCLRRGQIVFVNSSAGFARARGGYGAYSATKHALRAIADSLRDEVNPSGVRVLTAFPGRTASAMQAEVHRFEERPYDPSQWMQPEDVAEAIVAALTLPPTAELTDLHIRPRSG